MARPAIEIVSDAKRKIDKERQRGDFQPAPYFDAQVAAAHILCEIETIQAIKGDGIYQR